MSYPTCNVPHHSRADMNSQSVAPGVKGEEKSAQTVLLRHQVATDLTTPTVKQKLRITTS